MKATNQRKGKGAEFLVFSELLRGDADLYLPAVDTGIDAVVRKKDGTYLEIQVKSTEADEQAGCFNAYDLDCYDEERYFIVCVDLSRQPPETWILPCGVFKEYATKPWESKKGWKSYRLDVNARDTQHGNKPRREILQEYRNAWGLLTG